MVPYLLSSNPWKYINDNSQWSTNASYRILMSDIYKLLFTVGIGLITISIVILFIKWALYKNQDGALNRRNTIVGPLLFKLALVGVINCLPYLIGEVYRIVNAIGRALVGIV